jgi:hypothetical protein
MGRAGGGRGQPLTEKHKYNDLVFYIWGERKVTTNLFYKEYYHTKQSSENQLKNMAEFSKKGYGWKITVLPMMM